MATECNIIHLYESSSALDASYLSLLGDIVGFSSDTALLHL